jgi:hypothetical protein
VELAVLASLERMLGLPEVLLGLLPVQFRYRRLGDRLRHILAVLPFFAVQRF